MIVCGLDSSKCDTIQLIEFGDHPIAHRFLDDPNDDEYTNPLTLTFCKNCGLVRIENPIPAKELYTNYGWLSSWRPQPHAPRLVEMIESLDGLGKDAKILEVGSNDGLFLSMLKSAGFANVVGVDPAEDARTAAIEKGIDSVKRGPKLWGVLGSTKAGVEEFSYSAALSQLGGTWTLAEFNAFIAAPIDYLPGTTMWITGVKDPVDRANLIAYLRQNSDDPPPLPASVADK